MHAMTDKAQNTPPGARSPQSRSARLAWLLDSQFQIPGTSIRVGLDGLIGIIPGIGDTITTCLSLLIIAEAVQLRVSKRTLLAMGGNVALDWVVGLVPLLGDVFDIMYKANMRNLALLEADLAGRARTAGLDGSAPRARKIKNVAAKPGAAGA